MLGLQEKCGVIAVANHQDAIYNCLIGLHALQHRGHEAFGVALWHKNAMQIHHKKGSVMPSIQDFVATEGKYAIGHIRYSTSGGLDFCQPVYAKTNIGEIAIAHNGNLINSDAIRENLMQIGRIFQSNVDTEVFTHLIAESKKENFIDKIIDSLLQVKGAYSLVLLYQDKIFGIRDSYGIRPLVLGRANNSYVLASETCALDALNATFIRDIAPGEIIEITDDKCTSYFLPQKQKRSFCIFEYIYFARSDSLLEGKNVYTVRKAIGKQLAHESYTQTDMIVPVLDSGMAAALGYSDYAKIPLELAIARNHYAGRTFIEPTNQRRTLKIKLKHNANRHILKGKNITLIDDSIVRGNTLKQIVLILKDAGVNQIHIKIASPKMINPCYYGVDTPDKAGLIAANLRLEQIEKELGVDSIYFLTLEGLYKAVTGSEDRSGFCDACFSGNYPIV